MTGNIPLDRIKREKREEEKKKMMKEFGDLGLEIFFWGRFKGIFGFF